MGSFTLTHWAFVVLVPITLLVLLVKAGILIFRRLSNKSGISQGSDPTSKQRDDKRHSVGSWMVLFLYAATLYACAGVFSSAGWYDLSQLFGAAASLTVLYGVVRLFKKNEAVSSEEGSRSHDGSA